MWPWKPLSPKDESPDDLPPDAKRKRERLFLGELPPFEMHAVVEAKIQEHSQADNDIMTLRLPYRNF